MELEVARKEVNRVIRHLRWAMQLQDWKIDVEYRKLDDGVKGQVYSKPRYQTARICLDPVEAEDVDDLLITLRHEMLHILHSEFEVVRDAAHDLCQSNREKALLDGAWIESSERCVVMLERMIDVGLGLDVKGLVRQTKRVIAQREKSS